MSVGGGSVIHMTTALHTDSELLAVVVRVGDEARALDVQRAAIAGEVGSREDLFRAAGHSRAASLLAELWRVTLSEAQRFVDVGLATRERVAIDGSPLPARFEVVASALGSLGVDKAAVAIRELSRAHCSYEERLLGETALVSQASGFSVADFGVLARQVRDRLDQDGACPRDEQHRANRSLRITALANGMTRVVWEMPPETAGLVRAGIDAIVSSQLRQAQDDEHHEDRSFEQLRSDAAADIFHHVATCAHAGGDLPAITMVVRMTLDSLLTGSGFADIDGVAETISATTARHLAAEAEFLPMVLDGHGMPLDYGHPRRLFSRAQKLAFIQRDGGCAFAGCSSPPAYGEAHHIEWWSHGGLTYLNNGVMLCSFHHHRIHNDGWEIEIRDHVPYVIPPPWVDPSRAPRQGGRVVLGSVA
jgi:hypothetical protein